MENIKNAALEAITELCQVANIKAGQIVVIGCSTSEVDGGTIGKNSNFDLGTLLFETINGYLNERGIFLAAQCCEHLNRAIVIERAALKGAAEVCVVPQPKAGGSFATAAFKGFSEPAVVENISADAGIDIGLTLIGMHLKEVAVPVRLKTKKIGNALITAAYTRPKFIGGERAVYK